MLFEDPPVAVVLVDVPAEERVGGSPGRVGRPRSPDMGNSIGDGPFIVLDVADVAEEIRIECGHIEVIDGLLGRPLGVPHPAHAFVPLAAVGRDAVKVRFLPPDDNPLQAVQDRLGTGETPHRLDGRMDDASPDGIGAGTPGEPLSST